MLILLDWAFLWLHALLILFNMVGWAWKRTRLLHLITFGATAFSWFVLGAFYGWGYCLCTDWHFQVRRQLGYADPYTSYVQLLFEELLGIPISRPVADVIAGAVFAFILIATCVVWIRDWRRGRARRRRQTDGPH